MRVLIAPDKFRGSLSAPAAARAMAAAVRRVFPDAEIAEKPLADGGEGTVDALVGALGGRTVFRSVTGPVGDPVEAKFGLIDDGRAVIEVAAACGIALLDEAHFDPLHATSLGVGELLEEALALDVTGAIMGIGGTASSDGGTGAATASGWRFLDRDGVALPPGGGALVHLARIDGSFAHPIGVPVVAGYDVTNPLTGDAGAARVFGPRKGASEAEIEVLAAGLARLAERIEIDLGVNVSPMLGSGAGGGLGAGAVAFFGATLRPALDLIMDAIGLDDFIAQADLVITGEGKLDDQSLFGKVPIGVARRAARAGTRCIAVAGAVELDDAALKGAGIDRTISLVAVHGRSRAFEEPELAIEEATAALLAGYR
ncbi:MAG TPA: glycerate kinase [Actinomycetota bacterium]|nr:glycerate kinase [Actinomycetota bacterium]